MSRRLALFGLLAAAFVVFVSLGVWQLERREWKLDLIALVTQNQAAEPIPAPGPEQWPSLRPQDAYRRVVLTGTWDHSAETSVQAMTVMGSGYWVLTPLREYRGFTVLVNRGYVDPLRSLADARPESLTQGTVTISGLLRWTEPQGRFLAQNAPEQDRWYSRDVAAIAQKRQLSPAETAPYFVDADAATNPKLGEVEWPVGGLTVVKFRNAHLGYAVTWFALGGLSLLGIGLLVRDARSQRT